MAQQEPQTTEDMPMVDYYLRQRYPGEGQACNRCGWTWCKPKAAQLALFPTPVHIPPRRTEASP